MKLGDVSRLSTSNQGVSPIVLWSKGGYFISLFSGLRINLSYVGGKSTYVTEGYHV